MALPLERESPAIRTQEDFGTSPGAGPGLHQLLPSLGVTARPTSEISGATTPASPLVRVNRTSISSTPTLPPVPETASTQQSLPLASEHHTQMIDSIDSDGLATPRQGYLSGMSTAEPSRQQAQVNTSRSHEPSPLGRYYLATSDPQHISKHPQGSISFPGISLATTPTNSVLPGFNTSPALRNTGERESPTLSMASDEALMLGDDFPSDSRAKKSLFPMFPSQASTSGSRRIGSSRLSASGPAVSPHQIPLPPSPHMIGAPASPRGSTTGSPGLRGMGLGFGGTGGHLGSGRPPPSPSQMQRHAQKPDTRTGESTRSSERIPAERPPLRQETTDSFASTSSEEEDISSPMVLPDTSLRASDRNASSPRTGLSSNMGVGLGHDSTSKGLFPAWSDVQRFDKMAKNPFAFGAESTTFPPATIAGAKFTFRPGNDAPTFPPMSPSSSSSFDSDDETPTRGPNTARFSGPVSPKKRVRYVDEYHGDRAAEDAGDYGHGYGVDRGYKADSGRDGDRSGSITVGGRGYGDGSSVVPTAKDIHQGNESSDDEDRPRAGRSIDKKLENPSSRHPRPADSEEKTVAADNLVDRTNEDILVTMNDTNASEDDDNRTATTAQESTDSDESVSEYEGETPGPKSKTRKRKALRAEVHSNGADSKSEGSSSSRPDFMPSKAKRRKAGPADEGDVHCDYVEPLPVSLKSWSESSRNACNITRYLD